MNRIRSSVLALALLGVIVAGCATNPVTGRRELSLVSPQQELQMGLEGYKAVTVEYGLYDDPKVQAYVDSVGQKVARASHLPNLAWHFTVIDDPSVNAFAMPGGYIYVTRGILPYPSSEAQLAGVLGHECGHVTHRHTAEQMTQQTLYGAGLGLAGAFSETVRKYSGLAQQGLQLLFLKYSRGDETEADELGIQYATAAGYDPRQIPATYAMLKRISDQSGQRLPGFLSTHPDPGDREERTAELSKAAVQGKQGLLVISRPYVQRMDGMVFGNDPRQGYFSGDVYIQPTMRFQIALPAGWQHQDSHTSLAAQEPNKAGVLQLSTAADAGTLDPQGYVQQLTTKGAIGGANGAPERIGGFPAWVGHVQVPQQQGTPIIAVAAFIRRDDKLMIEALGQSATAGDANEAKILASFRSFAGVTDPARLDVRPDRVRVAKVPKAAPIEEVIGTLGGPASFMPSNLILNDAEAGETMNAGTLIKFVTSGKH